MDTCFNALLLNAERGLRATPNGAEIDVRLPWYRSLPVSVVEVGSLKVDEQDVASSDIRFELNGKSFELQDLPAHSGEFWFVLVGCRSCRHSRRRDVASTYGLFDMPAKHAGS